MFFLDEASNLLLREEVFFLDEASNLLLRHGTVLLARHLIMTSERIPIKLISTHETSFTCINSRGS